MGKFMKKLVGLLCIMTLSGSLFIACSDKEDSSKDDSSKEISVEKNLATPTPVEEENWQVEVDSNAKQISIDNTKTYQTIDGFGAAFTWYSDWMTNNPYDSEAYDLAFKDAKITILRFRNTYGYEANFAPKMELEIYQEAAKRAAKRGEKVTVLLSSWSPAPYLKDNGKTSDGGTLKKDENGKYVYDELGAYWLELIQAYEAYGIPIDYITIQNELDLGADCGFAPEETDKLAGYVDAHMAVYKALQNMDNPPKILAPETMSVDFTQIKRYMEPVIEQAPDSFYGIAHHLYAGADASNPNSYMTNMFTIKKLYPQYAKWQTEYYIGDAFTTAWLIHNSLVYEELNAYLYWDGAWAVHEDGERGFLNFENPFDQANWKSEKGYYIGEKYYAIRHYSEFIRPGYKRIDVAPTGARELLVSAYASPSQDKIAAVILNTSDKDMYIQLNFSSYHVLDSNLYVSSCKESHTMDDLFVDGGKLSDKQTLTIPAKGIVTVDITGEPSNNIQTQTDNNTVTTDTNNNEKEDIVVITNQSTAVPGIPSLDGKYDSIWDKASSQNLKVLAVGIEGASANFKTLWSDQYLYVHVGVKDKTTDTSAEDFADKDGVEFFMNESNTKPSSYSDGDAYYIVSRDNETSFGTGADKTNFKSITYETEDGYVVEAAIPLTTMKGEIGVKVGFDLQVNDSQGKGKSEYIIKWNDTSLLTTENLDRIGEVLFQ